MNFNEAAEVEAVYHQMRVADYRRSSNRAAINDLFNGLPPESAEEAEENFHPVNYNSLEGTRIGHDARAQFYNAFLKPGHYFASTLDMGPVHKRSIWSTIVTSERSKIMKRSLPYFECYRSKFAMNVLHGIGPSVFPNEFRWRPDPVGIEDVLMPGGTLLTMENVPFFCTYDSWSVPQLIKMARGPNVDPGWNQPLVDKIIENIDEKASQLMSANWPDVWVPEKKSERVKSDGSVYASDAIPSVNVIHFYFWSDEGKKEGWRRRTILDAWNPPVGDPSIGVSMRRKDGDLYSGKEFLYTSRNRCVANSMQEIINFQFADLSAVAPFKYHSVRSLGFLLYSVLHIQNRMRCRFTEAVFEQMMMYFRVKNMTDAQRALKVDLINKGFLDDSVNFIPPQERYQIDHQLAQLGLEENARLIAQHSSGYLQNVNGPADRKEKTAFQVMTEANQTASLVGAALNQAYQYQDFENREIARRFFRKNSNDPDVVRFRAACLKQEVPQKYLDMPEAWEHKAERVMGAGNKTVELAVAQQLLSIRNLLDPDPQRQVLRDAILAFTDDAARTEALVPEKKTAITDSTYAAQLAAGALMQGLPVGIKTGMNHIDYVEALLVSMAITIQGIEQTDNMGTLQQVQGLNNMASHISEHIALIAQDENEKQRVKEYSDQLGQLMNLVKAFAQRLAEKMQQQNGQGDPRLAAEIQAELIRAEAKAQNTRDAHSQRTAQRQIQWELDQERKSQQAAFDLQKKQAEAQIELSTKQASAELDIAKEAANLAAKPKPKGGEE